MPSRVITIANIFAPTMKCEVTRRSRKISKLLRNTIKTIRKVKRASGWSQIFLLIWCVFQKTYKCTSQSLKTIILFKYFENQSTDGYLKGFLRLLKSNIEDSADNMAEIVGSPLMANVPESLDWRSKGFITPPYNQLSCGSCYAFSIAESIMGQVFKRTGKILSLSKQQIVDCSVSHGNQGCVGGSLRNTLSYLQSTGGIMREQDYPYVARVNTKQLGR